ncbi:MAG: hypothetical protein ACLRSW_09420 [Christensenellaceae bacterium]
MTTPLCMIILGVRLGGMRFGRFFRENAVSYRFGRQMIFRLSPSGVYIFPFEEYIRQTIFILACCPSPASF